MNNKLLIIIAALIIGGGALWYTDGNLGQFKGDLTEDEIVACTEDSVCQAANPDWACHLTPGTGGKEGICGFSRACDQNSDCPSGNECYRNECRQTCGWIGGSWLECPETPVMMRCLDPGPGICVDAQCQNNDHCANMPNGKNTCYQGMCVAF